VSANTTWPRALHLCGFARRTLGGVDPALLAAEIECVHPAVRAWPAGRGARGRPPTVIPARVTQSHDVTLARFIERFDSPIVHPCQPVQIGFVGRLERRTDEASVSALADHHSGACPGSDPRRYKALGLAGGHRENRKPLAKVSARSRSGFSNSSQAKSVTLIVGLTERPPVLTPVGSVLAVEVGVPVDCIAVAVIGHLYSFFGCCSAGAITGHRAPPRARGDDCRRGRRRWFRSRRCAGLGGRGLGGGHTVGTTAGRRGRGDATGIPASFGFVQ